ncbi:MAG: TIGR03668 family PPOX class F420-dependent oxidoreductase [Acidobacteria bacterium]|nr:TIGR03668 family PPOX class F420-dependent oxidoreductase [Acidobacteriota bacterium]
MDAFIRESRVARLATVSRDGQPLVVPICYAYDGERLYSVIDQKPKRVPGEKLKRVRNIQENSKVSVVIDEYDEDWTKLRYVIIRAEAEILIEGQEHERAIALLRKKYPQYQRMNITGKPVIRMTPTRIIHWQVGEPGGDC